LQIPFCCFTRSVYLSDPEIRQEGLFSIHALFIHPPWFEFNGWLKLILSFDRAILFINEKPKDPFDSAPFICPWCKTPFILKKRFNADPLERLP
jgi:hypothetical protein